MPHVGDVGEGRGNAMKALRGNVGDKEKGDALRKSARSVGI